MQGGSNVTSTMPQWARVTRRRKWAAVVLALAGLAGSVGVDGPALAGADTTVPDTAEGTTPADTGARRAWGRPTVSAWFTSTRSVPPDSVAGMARRSDPWSVRSLSSVRRA